MFQLRPEFLKLMVTSCLIVAFRLAINECLYKGRDNEDETEVFDLETFASKEEVMDITVGNKVK